uniref:Ig-like domain-containing protein n=1 Tax=Ornithorhynchus anatinus TaxID=9258 RepID=A0A6I8N589_ORNAN
MGPGSVWLVAVCVLGAGPTDAGVTQTPRHLVTSRGQNLTLSCVPISSHYGLFWYRQRIGEGLELLMSFQNKESMEKMGSNDSYRFSVSWFQEKSCHLHVNPSSPSDSAFYLCASSEDTALQSTLPSVHKPPHPESRHRVMPGSEGAWEVLRSQLLSPAPSLCTPAPPTAQRSPQSTGTCCFSLLRKESS